ncbi:MAG: DUF4143 domain-containing protein [Bacteroidales bacterium]|nr:DUF4143 domain-containing protein [Bacteroidales bacterium]
MENFTYKPRIADTILQRKMQGKGAVLIEGPKWCGKTTTAQQIAKSSLMLGKKSVLEKSRELAEFNPDLLLAGDTPRLLDEWQTIPALWDEVRSTVDERHQLGQFVLTGSSVLPEATETIHSGTGRIGHLNMRPMSLYESGESNGTVSLSCLFNGENLGTCRNELVLQDICYLICRGGWPQATLLQGDVALDQAFDYVKSVVSKDIIRVDQVRRSPERARMIMRSYARNQGHQIPYTTICEDIKSNDRQSISDDTVADYVEALRKLFVVEDMPAWNPNLRSKTAIRTSHNRYFVDPSIAAASLRVSPKDLEQDPKACGMFFEGLVVRDLRIFADALLGEVYHYRDNRGLECDAVLHRRNGQYALIEIKLGGITKIKEGAATLNALKQDLDPAKMPMPSFCMIVTAGGDYAYQRKEDGIFVVPIGCLKP